MSSIIQPEDAQIQQSALFLWLSHDGLSSPMRFTDTVTFSKGSKIIQGSGDGYRLYLLLTRTTIGVLLGLQAAVQILSSIGHELDHRLRPPTRSISTSCTA